MDDRKHEGTEFSNISEMWNQNERDKHGSDEFHDNGNEFSNVSQVWDQNERTKGEPGARSIDDNRHDAAVDNDELEQIIEEEAAEFDEREDIAASE